MARSEGSLPFAKGLVSCSHSVYTHSFIHFGLISFFFVTGAIFVEAEIDDQNASGKRFALDVD